MHYLVNRFKEIPEARGRQFEWNPCITFTDGDCKEVLSCQTTDTARNPAGTKDTTFSVDSEGNAVITYGKSTASDGTERQTKITLKCDLETNGTKPTGFTGKVDGKLTSGTYLSRYCCAVGGSSGGLSAGSILLIIDLEALAYFLNKRPVLDPPTSTLTRLAELVLTLNAFTFNGDFYQQIGGVAMGSKMGPNYACLFVGYVEERIASQYHGFVPQLHKRYIDDVIGVAFCSRVDLENYIRFVSNFYPALQFTHNL
ncbi:unnamed protein product [Porites evermanni]|uniref:Reverse transcriptase domain-containing protein n=1 Tax=Porites evermanni TaxID=104178 RepID=A0ABN8SGX9_9CNID|nr:unnamed protein product [Porites evermanni]